MINTIKYNFKFFNRFISKIEDMFNKLILISAFSTVFMVVVILVAITNQSDFIPGYVLGATVSTNLLLGFTFGTILQMKVHSLYNLKRLSILSIAYVL